MGHPRSFSNSPPLFEQVEVYHKEVEGLVFATGVGVLPAPAHVVFAVLTDDVLRPALWPNWKSGARLESMPPRELEQLRVAQGGGGSGGEAGAGILFEVRTNSHHLSASARTC